MKPKRLGRRCVDHFPDILYPAKGRTGDNVLIGTKTMIPIDGPVRENTGLLGSSCFEIPRVVATDACALKPVDKEARARGLKQKNIINLQTMLGYFVANWILLFVTALLGLAGLGYYPQYGFIVLLVATYAAALFAIFWFVLVEKVSLAFAKLEVRTVTLYDPYYWFHERHWKFCGHPLMTLFHGTPFRNVISWALGVSLGQKVFDDGANLYDKSLISIGSYVNLNAACVVQGHSLEEGVFKSDKVHISAGCSLAAGAFVHYGVHMGENVELGPNAFLMKGEAPPKGSLWQGNPARPVRSRRV